MTLLDNIRNLLLYLCALGLLGTGVELLLMEHTEEFTQLIPLIVIGIGLVSIIAHKILNSKGSLLFIKSIMLVTAISGFAGMIFHFNSNMEFAIELSPELSGFDLFLKTIKGTTPPTLAPGNMTLLGCLGLIYGYRFNNLKKEKIT